MAITDTSTTYTQLWTLTAGSTTLRYTTWDRDLVYTYDGFTYSQAPLNPTNFDERSDLSANQMEIGIQIASAGIAENRLVAGSWDRARLTIQFIDAASLGTAPVRRWRGQLARGVVKNGILVRAEFLSLSQLYTQPIGDLYSPRCRVVEYGDAQCGKNITAETFSTAITGTPTDGAHFVITNVQADGYYNFGTLLFTSGANNGLKKEIRSNVAGTLVMAEEFPFTIVSGDTCTVVRGCDREFATCVLRSNAERFRGEPNIPGIWKTLKRFPA